MSFKRETIKNYYLHNTPVENVFINEFMIDAPGDYVKVYLFALMYAEIRMAMTNDTIAKQLSMDEEDVLKAWTYWESKGVIKKHYINTKDRLHYKVEFLNLKELIYCKNNKGKKDEKSLPTDLAGLMSDKELKDLYSRIEQITGRLFEGKEPAAILEWLKDYNISKEIIIYAYEYCTKRDKNKLNYVGAVVKEWAEKGLKTVKEVEDYLEQTDSRHYLYKRVLKALGFLRNPTEEEKRIIDIWFDEMKLDIATVLSACNKTSGISNPNINYVNSVLRAWQSEGKSKVKISSTANNIISRVVKSYEEERSKNEALAETRRQEVYKAVPRIKEIEEEMRLTGIEISKAMLSGGQGSKARIKELKNKAERLNEEKSYLLTDNNFRVNYMDIQYTCPYCKDTGLLDNGERCSCFADKLDRYGKNV